MINYALPLSINKMFDTPTSITTLLFMCCILNWHTWITLPRKFRVIFAFEKSLESDPYLIQGFFFQFPKMIYFISTWVFDSLLFSAKNDSRSQDIFAAQSLNFFFLSINTSGLEQYSFNSVKKPTKFISLLERPV